MKPNTRKTMKTKVENIVKLGQLVWKISMRISRQFWKPNWFEIIDFSVKAETNWYRK
jgi:hypothetical protein